MVNQFFTNEECESIISDLETGEWINHTWTQQNENGELAKIDKKDFLVQFNHKHNEFFFRCLIIHLNH